MGWDWMANHLKRDVLCVCISTRFVHLSWRSLIIAFGITMIAYFSTARATYVYVPKNPMMIAYDILKPPTFRRKDFVADL